MASVQKGKLLSKQVIQEKGYDELAIKFYDCNINEKCLS